MEKVLEFNKRIKGVVKNPKLINVGPTFIPDRVGELYSI